MTKTKTTTHKYLGKKVGYITPLCPDGEGAEIVAVEQPWLSSGDDTLLFTLRTWDNRTVSSTSDGIAW